MKSEITTYISGGLAIEVIAETDMEYSILDKAWEQNGYKRGNGQSKAPNGYSVGFYIPLGELTPSQDVPPNNGTDATP